MTEKQTATPEDVAKFMQSQTKELYERQSKRKELPTGVYIQFVGVPGSETLPLTKHGDLYLKFEAVPLREPGNGESAIIQMKTNMTFFPPKPAKEGEQEFSSLYKWEQLLTATDYKPSRGGPQPARGEYDRRTKKYVVDGVQVEREAWALRNESERPEWQRQAILDIFTRIAQGESPLGNLAFFAKLVRNEEGFINVEQSKGKGGGPILGSLPAGEAYAEL